MSFAVLFAATLPGLVLLLIVLAAVEHLSIRRKGRGLVTRDERPSLSAAGLDVFSASMLPGRAAELEHREEAKQRRVGHADGAPPHGVDLAGGTARITPRDRQ